jgi:hypothetical protein
VPNGRRSSQSDPVSRPMWPARADHYKNITLLLALQGFLGYKFHSKNHFNKHLSDKEITV